tara:strand:+ start:577 stop:1083 length:507 start_codon:yes stop_codon:yes gene_type:complete
LEVIPLNITHLKSCLELDKKALNGLWSKENWEKELINKGKICLGIINQCELIAVATGLLIIDEFNLTAIAVDPSHRKKGLGLLLLRELLREAKNRGSESATLEVDENNIPAIKLYKHCGFITSGYREKYYKNGNNALIQNLSLAQEAPLTRRMVRFTDHPPGKWQDVL